MPVQSAPGESIEQGDPALDAKAFRRSLGQYATGVTIVTARHDGQLLGMAVNSFAAVSLAPPTVLWSIRRESRSAQAFLQTSHFAVSILAEGQVEVSQAFGAGLPDRFDRVAWREGLGGAPLIEGAIAHLECSTEATYDGGDHHILLGRVVRHVRFQGAPLVFSQGQYAVTQNHPELAAASERTADPAGSGQAALPNFLRLLSVTSQRMSSSFQVHRDALDLTPAMARILSVLQACDSSLDELERTTYLGRLNLEDALSSLYVRGQVERTPQGRHKLTAAGQGKREALARRSARFQQEKLHGVAPADIAAAWRVLSALQRR